LEKHEILKLKLLSSRFLRYVQEALKFYPPRPIFIDVNITNEVYCTDKMLRWKLSESDNGLKNITHWIVEVIPRQDKNRTSRIIVPKEDSSYIVKLSNLISSANIYVIAKNKMSGTRSIVKKVEYRDPIDYTKPDPYFIIKTPLPTQKEPVLTPYVKTPVPTPINNYKQSDTFKGCFEGRALIKMADLTKKCAKNIVVGDVVMGGDGKGYKVKKVMTAMEKCEKLMVNISNFWITRGHPILQNSDWYRPDEMSKSEPMMIEQGLINFLLEGEEHTVLVGGKDEKSEYGQDKGEIVCCTLGKYCGPRLASLYPHHNELFHLAYLKKN